MQNSLHGRRKSLGRRQGMTDKEVISETERWIKRLNDLSTRTENKEHVDKHVRLLERLIKMAGEKNE